MADIAQIGFRADTSELADAKLKLDALAPAAARADSGAARLAGTLDRTGASAATASAGMRSTATASDQLARSTTSVDRAAAGMAGTLDARVTPALRNSAHGAQINSVTMREMLVVSRELAAGNFTRLAGSLSILIPQLGNLRNNGVTFTGVLRAIGLQFGILKTQVSSTAGAFAQEALAEQAAAIQARDFLAMAVARGEAAIVAADTELTLALASAEVATGSTVEAAAQARVAAAHEAVAVAAGEAAVAESALAEANATVATTSEAASGIMTTGLGTIGIIVLGIAAAVGVLAGIFALFARNTNRDFGDVAQTMDFSKQQMQRLGEQGVSTTVTLGDSFASFFHTLGEMITEHFGSQVDWIGEKIGSLWDLLSHGLYLFIGNLIASFAGGYGAIVAIWERLPGAIGDVAISAVNLVIGAIPRMINASIEGIDALLAHLPDWVTSRTGTINYRMPVAHMNNPYAGQAAGLGPAIGHGFQEGAQAGSDFVNEFGQRWEENAELRRRNRLAHAAGANPREPRGRHPREHRDPFQEIVNKANEHIALTQAEIAAVGQSVEATARLKHEQELLNEATQKHLTLTGPQRAQLMALAATMAQFDAQLAHDKGMHEIIEGAQHTATQLHATGMEIGLVGFALARTRYEQDMLSQAQQKHIILSDADTQAIHRQAVALARLSAANDNARFYSDERRTITENLANLQTEYDAIGLSARATAELTMTRRLDNEERLHGIRLSPEERANLVAGAGEMADLTERIRQHREALEFAKDAAKGFFSDMVHGLEQGKSVWETFGNAVMNVLNKLIDKLIEASIEGLFSHGGGQSGGTGGFLGALSHVLASLFTSGGGGGDLGPVASDFNLPFAKGHAFDRNGLTGFSKGSAFANTIVREPTLFKFAKGASLGVMGEKGPEGILPLQRGPDGSLGVQMYGGRGGTVIHAPVTINNDNRVTGAVSSADIVAMQRAAAEQTKNDVKRSLTGWINDIERDGAVA